MCLFTCSVFDICMYLCMCRVFLIYICGICSCVRSIWYMYVFIGVSGFFDICMCLCMCRVFLIHVCGVCSCVRPFAYMCVSIDM